MNEARIIEIFAQMAGISRETALEQTPLAIMAEDKIKGRLREDYDGSNETLLTYVAASLVNLWYSHSRASGSPTGSFSGNGIRVRYSKERRISLRLLRRSARTATWRKRR